MRLAHEDEVDGPKLPEDDSPVIIQRTGGRISLRPSGVGGFGCDCDHTLTVFAQLTSILMQRPAPSDASSTTLKSTDLHSLPTATPTTVSSHRLSESVCFSKSAHRAASQ